MAIEIALKDLRLPILQAPMTRVSSLKLAIASSRSGVIGAFQVHNPRTPEELTHWLEDIARERNDRHARGKPFAPYAVNINAGQQEKFAVVERARVPLVISSTGDPAEVVRRAHAWGGRVIHDVTTLHFAEKALAAGVDGQNLARRLKLQA